MVKPAEGPLKAVVLVLGVLIPSSYVYPIRTINNSLYAYSPPNLY